MSIFIKLADKLGLEIKIFSQTTRTSQDAANQVGCQLGQIAKSLIFKRSVSNSESPVLVIVSGANRVSIKKLQALFNSIKPASESFSVCVIEKADADFVYQSTGFPIGGVPPFGHKNKIPYVFFDKDLLQYDEVWCAAGTPFSVFKIAPGKLAEIADAQIVDIKE